MFKFLRQVLFISLTVTFHAKAYARGGMSDGGGCITTTQPPVLSDLVYAGKRLTQNQAGDKVTISGAMRSIGVAPIDLKELKSYQLARSLVEKWADNRDVWSVYLNSALKSLHKLTFFGAPTRFTRAPKDLCRPFPSGVTEAQIRPVVVFHEDALVVALEDFNSMDLYGQAGIWIHESFRVMQILLKEPIPNEHVMHITAEILSAAKSSANLQQRYRPVGTLQETMRRQMSTRELSVKLCSLLQVSSRLESSLRESYASYCKGTAIQNGFTGGEVDALVRATWKPWVDRFKAVTAEKDRISLSEIHKRLFTPEMNELYNLFKQTQDLRNLISLSEFSRPGEFVVYYAGQLNLKNPIWQSLALGYVLEYAENPNKLGSGLAQDTQWVRDELSRLRGEWSRFLGVFSDPPVVRK